MEFGGVGTPVMAELWWWWKMRVFYEKEECIFFLCESGFF